MSGRSRKKLSRGRLENASHPSGEAEGAKRLSRHCFSRTRSRRRRATAGGGILLVLAALPLACGFGSEARIAHRILEDYRRKTRVKPLAPAQVIRLRLSAPAGRVAATGAAEIQWDPHRYREMTTSGGLTLVRGIQGGKAYWRDEDGVTRVVSDPVLSELTTRSYFWRRAFLFEDGEKARIELGPSDESSVSVRITPRGGNPLVLTFTRACDRLLSARSPRFDLAFEDATHFRDSSRPVAPVEGEIRWTGLPTGEMSDTQAGGGSARWSAEPASLGFERREDRLIVRGRIGGRDARIGLDAAVDGPIRVGGRFSQSLPLTFQPDVFGRMVAAGGTLELGSLSYPSVALQRVERMPDGADATAGAPLFRETVLELDPFENRLRFHDPARWVIPAGLSRVVIDDDGNRPVAILQRGRERLRLLAGTASGSALLLSPEAADRIGLSPGASTAAGLRWGAVDLDPLPLRIASEGLDPVWGDEGSLGWETLLRFHLFLDMPRRWIYLSPLEPAPVPSRPPA